MSHRTLVLLSMVVLLAFSSSARAGTLTSVFELNTNGSFEMEGQGTVNITGGTIKIRYPALGTRTPDTAGGSATILSASIQHTQGYIVFTGFPYMLSLQSGGVGSVKFQRDFFYFTGTHNGSTFTSGYVYLEINATLPPIASLPASSNMTLVDFYGRGDAPGTFISTIYTSFGPPPGNEISRTFEGDNDAPVFAAGAWLPVAAMLLALRFALRRNRAQS